MLFALGQREEQSEARFQVAGVVTQGFTVQVACALGLFEIKIG